MSVPRRKRLAVPNVFMLGKRGCLASAMTAGSWRPASPVLRGLVATRADRDLFFQDHGLVLCRGFAPAFFAG